MIDPHPWGELLTGELQEAGACIMGVPFDLAVSYAKGTAQAPERIRYLYRYLPPTTETGVYLNQLKVFDAGDMPLDLQWERYF